MECSCSISVIHRKQTKIKAHSLAICAVHFPVNLLYFLSVSYNHNKRAHTHYHIDPHRLIRVTGSLCRDSMQHTVQCHRCFACFLCVIVFGVFTILVQMNTSNKKQKTKQNKKRQRQQPHLIFCDLARDLFCKHHKEEWALARTFAHKFKCSHGI